MAEVYGGPISWELNRDAEGHRDYKVNWLVKVSVGEGPFAALAASGLPQVGDPWEILDKNSNPIDTIDTWAFCHPNSTVKPHQHKQGERPLPDKDLYFDVEQLFSTRPLKRCTDNPVEDPLDEPDQLSGSYVKYTKQAAFDRHGMLIMSSSHEMFKGPQVEFDDHKHNVKIVQNRAALELSLIAQYMRDGGVVNDAPIWGLPARCVKLSEFEWSLKYNGSCNIYYTRSFGFDIDFNTFDRRILDEGTKVLNGQWDTQTGQWRLLKINGVDPDPANPSHFCHFRDRKGQPIRAILNGAGLPALSTATSGTGTGTGSFDTGNAGQVNVEYYKEADLLALSIPAIIEQ